jgi:hypothetical protein
VADPLEPVLVLALRSALELRLVLGYLGLRLVLALEWLGLGWLAVQLGQPLGPRPLGSRVKRSLRSRPGHHQRRRW